MDRDRVRVGVTRLPAGIPYLQLSISEFSSRMRVRPHCPDGFVEDTFNLVPSKSHFPHSKSPIPTFLSSSPRPSVVIGAPLQSRDFRQRAPLFYNASVPQLRLGQDGRGRDGGGGWGAHKTIPSSSTATANSSAAAAAAAAQRAQRKHAVDNFKLVVINS